MKRVLIVKTSSLGDVIHMLPAITDAAKQLTVQFDWVVEENFVDIPAMHPAVNRVIPVALRRWRKSPWQAIRSGEVKRFWQTLRQVKYDAVIDAQSLFKSMLITSIAKGPSYGPNKESAREPWVARFYKHPLAISKRHNAQATTRIRELLAAALSYTFDAAALDYGLRLKHTPNPQTYCVFLHGTTWASKHWPESYWTELAHQASANGLRVYLPWGNEAERLRAERISAATGAIVLTKMSLQQLAEILAAAKAVVAVDTGLAHLAAALNVPTLAIYGATDPSLTGVQGQSVRILNANFSCAPCLKRRCTYPGVKPVDPPCYGSIPPAYVWQQLGALCAHENLQP